MDYPQKAESNITDKDFAKVITFIHQKKGLDLSTYRQTFVLRRLRAHFLMTKTKNYLEYIDLFNRSPDEFNKFLDTLGINVTEFFRDAEVFTAFRKLAIPELIKRKDAGNNRLIRVWSAACATGEESYSLAILLREELLGKSGFSVRILGTDMDKTALEKAVKAEYKANDLKKLDKKTLEKYFIPVYNNVYQLKDEIRQMVKFQQHNLITEEPLKFMDIIFCRNMMIYLNREQQQIMCRKFCESLNSGGYLVAGKVENIWDRELFNTVDLREKIYQRKG